jgi:hypothetical protein
MNQNQDKGQGLLGRKVGMMRIFTDDGDSIPVTVLDVSNNRVTQIKTPDTDGYSAVQVAFGQLAVLLVSIRLLPGILPKQVLKLAPMLKEFRVAASAASELKVGDVIAASLFEVGQKWTCKVCRSVRVTLVPSSVTTLVPVVLPTVTPVRIMCQARSVWRRIQVVFSLVSA